MDQQTVINSTEGRFKIFLFKNRTNRISLIVAAIAIIIQFSLFKYFYPFASYIHGDSFSYLRAAFYNLDINTYMVGYSRFLRLFSVFTSSDTLLVLFQYLLIQCSVLILLFTIFYFYKPGKFAHYLLLGFMVLNPLFLHLANLISSDGMFLALSVQWFTLLIWIIHSPSKKIIILHSIVLLLAFTVRYNALIYPFISAGAFFLSKLPMRMKLAGIAAGLILCGTFVTYTAYKYKKMTGFWQYSPFSGWQLANNAMYTYRYVDSSERKSVPKKFQKLDNMIREYFDSTRDIKKYPHEALQASTVYMWTPALPLYKYREVVFRKDSAASEMKRWSSMGPFFKEYGLLIIKKYPWHFARYFLWPNSQKYYAPPVEFLEQYNSGKDSVADIAKSWFGYKSRKVSTRFKSKDVQVLAFFPILSGIINVIMLCTLICYLLLKGWQVKDNFRLGIVLGAGLWFLNACFTISASSAALRFQSFPLLLSTIFSVLLTNWLWSIAYSKSATTNIIQTNAIEGNLTEKLMA